MALQETACRGRVIVVSGPSGVGKSTVCRALCERIPAEFSVSVTTRQRRPNETNARDYHYVSRERFEEMRASGDLLEWAEVYGNLYGTPAAPVQAALDSGRVTILEIDIQGCRQVRTRLPDIRAYFLLPPTMDEQKRRIEGRNTDPAEAIRMRLAKADGEIRYAMETRCYDEFIINDDLDQTVRRIVDHLRKENAGK